MLTSFDTIRDEINHWLCMSSDHRSFGAAVLFLFPNVSPLPRILQFPTLVVTVKFLYEMFPMCLNFVVSSWKLELDHRVRLRRFRLSH